MFDRIAGVYDRMNTVMTAGLHHEWRRRAADLAELAAGWTRARRRHRHRRPGVRAGLARRAGRRGGGRRLLRADAGAGARQGRRARRSAARAAVRAGNALALAYPRRRVRRRDGRLRRAQLLRPRRGLAEMARVVRPGGRVVVLEITTPRRPPLSTFFELWFDRVVPALGRLAGDSHAYSYLPSSVRRFPGPEELAAGCGRCGPAPDPLRADRRAASSRSTSGTVRDMMATGGTGRRRGRGRSRWPGCMDRVEERMAELATGHGGRARALRRRDDRRRRQAAAAAAGVPRRRRAAARDRRTACAPRSRSSWSTPRRSSTTTCSTARRLRRGRPTVVAAGGRGLATATGDLLFSRAFAELAGGGSADAVRVLSRASRELAVGELMQRADAWRRRVRRPLPRALPAEDRGAVPRRLRARRARGRRPMPTRSAASASGSGWRSSCSTTCST